MRRKIGTEKEVTNLKVAARTDKKETSIRISATTIRRITGSQDLKYETKYDGSDPQSFKNEGTQVSGRPNGKPRQSSPWTPSSLPSSLIFGGRGLRSSQPSVSVPVHQRYRVVLHPLRSEVFGSVPAQKGLRGREQLPLRP